MNYPDKMISSCPKSLSFKARGFTILEIIVVLSVIAILVGVAIPRFKGMQDEAKIARAKRELKTLQTALESYHIKFKTFPSSNSSISASLISARPQMIDSVLYDPLSATGTVEYGYLRSGDGKYYVIWSAGRAGQVAPTALSNAGELSF